jgi:6-phosphofructokinase
MRVAIMGSGGDAPGMYPAIKRFVEYSLEQRAKPWFVIDGLEGLVVLGGDESFRAMEIFTGEFDIAAVGIPTTIDNASLPRVAASVTR